MKTILVSTSVLMFLSLSITKDINCSKIKTTTPITKITPLSKEKILVQKTWRIDQLQSLINGIHAAFYLGGTNTTGRNLSLNRYQFNADGTASYTDENGNHFTANWQFTDSDKRTIRFTIYSASANVNNWEMIVIEDNYLQGTQRFTVNGNPNNLQSFRLIQIP
jgi:hypothetical protein